MQELSKATIEDAFREMGEILVRAGKTAEIAVYGGAAIMLQFEVTFRTRDVDAQVQCGDHGALMQAARDNYRGMISTTLARHRQRNTNGRKY
jgi:hypothetical protein